MFFLESLLFLVFFSSLAVFTSLIPGRHSISNLYVTLSLEVSVYSTLLTLSKCILISEHKFYPSVIPCLTATSSEFISSKGFQSNEIIFVFLELTNKSAKSLMCYTANTLIVISCSTSKPMNLDYLLTCWYIGLIT